MMFTLLENQWSSIPGKPLVNKVVLVQFRIQLKCHTSSCCALWISVSKSSGLSWSVSLSVVLRPQKKVGGSWRLLAFSSSSGVGFFSHTTWQSGSEYKRHKVCVKIKSKLWTSQQQVQITFPFRLFPPTGFKQINWGFMMHCYLSSQCGCSAKFIS